MLESTRPRPQEDFVPGPGAPSDVFSQGDVGGLVTVNHGLHTEQLPVGNMTVGEIRARYTDRFDIDPHSQAQIDGTPVGDDTVCRPGQMLMFVRHAGEKG
jgi:hypothetical protein